VADNFLDELESYGHADGGDVLDEIAGYTPAAQAPAQPDKGWFGRRVDEFKRTYQLATRSAIKGVTAFPVMAADAGIGLRNAITGENYEGVGQMLERGMDKIGLPRPEGRLEKINDFALSAATGAVLPAPQAAHLAPKGFIPPSANPMSGTLSAAREAGYVVPPASAKPTMLNRALEGATGKASTAQGAAIKNQKVTNDLVKKALGMASDEPITLEALDGIRANAGKVYKAIEAAGRIIPDEQYLDDLAALGRGADEIAGAFPGANVGATKQISDLVDSLLQNGFDAKPALQYLRELRKMASGNLSGMNATDPAKQALGMAQREAAATLEDLIGRHLEKIGQGEVAQAFSGARKMIAMTHTVEKALNESTGNVVAGKLGQQLSKGKPLTGELEIAAKFAQAFPKAAKEVTESMPGISPLDLYATLGTGMLSGQPWMAALPATRMGLRELLLSAPGQSLGVGRGVLKPPSNQLGLAPSALLQLASPTD
jgi:hypothetical protein